MKVLVTGATGYIGGRLVPRLLEAGHEVRVLVRDRGRIPPWPVEAVEGDLRQEGVAERALEGVEAAYFLVHAMHMGPRFQELEEAMACRFARAAGRLGVKVIYLGGLLPKGGRPSRHLLSRARVGEILRGEAPATEFRAGPIIGSGSASFEMVRYLTERLPVMLAPRWILNPVSPLAVRDALSYLLLALGRPPLGVVEVGAEALTFKAMMEVYAEVRGLRRVILPVPVLAPRLAALWVGLVTPIPNRLAVPLVEGILHPLVADTGRAQALFPGVQPIPYRRAVELALERISLGQVETRWSGAQGVYPAYRLEDWEGLIREVQVLEAPVPPERLFTAFSTLGGETGWLVWEWAWALRGFLDRLLGGPGLRRGRRHPRELRVGEALDFFRVEALEPGRLLRLRAEMLVPGRAWLEWRAEPRKGGSLLVQTAYFEPKGLAGLLYWWSLYLPHRLIFRDLARAIVRRAMDLEGQTAPSLPKGPPGGRGGG